MTRTAVIIILTLLCRLSAGQVSGSGYINTGRDKIFFESAGSGEAIILIHDGLLDRELWDNQFTFFSKRYTVIRYDRRGYGNSFPAIGNYSNIDDLNSLYTQLGIDSAILIGCSSGGALAIDFTLRFPEKVTSLVLVGASVHGLPFTEHFMTRGGHLPSDLKNDRQAGLYLINSDPYEIYSANTEAREKASKLIANNPLAIYTHPQDITDSIPTFRRLQDIKIPVLIVTGEFDMPDIQAHAGALNAGITKSERIIIPGSGHLVPLEQPDLFNDAVIKFLKASRRTSRK